MKTVDFSGIRTRIDGAEGELADRLTTTFALNKIRSKAYVLAFGISGCSWISSYVNE